MKIVEPLVGKQIDQYQVERLISRGGMAEVYLAEDVTLRRKVALKVMLSELASLPELTARFQREAEIVARLDHPNIIQIFTIGLAPVKRPYLAMQFIDGGSLHDYISALASRGEYMPTTTVLFIARQIAAALDAAHQAGIVHRDLKPGNILMRSDGVPVVTDLGIAAIKTEATRLTRTGSVMGTPYYMSPEQVKGGSVDGRSDIYALGVILYEMLAGRVPFEADSPIAVLHQHLYEPPPPLFRLRRDLSETTYRTVDQCLQKEPTSRFQTASQVIAALDHNLEVEQGRPPTAEYPVIPQLPPTEPLTGPPSRPPDLFPERIPTAQPPQEKPKTAWWQFALVVAAVLFVGGGLYWIFGRSQPPGPPTSRTPPSNEPVEIAAGGISPTTSVSEESAQLPAAVSSTPTETPASPPTDTPTLSPTPMPSLTPTSTSTPLPSPTPSAPSLPVPALVPPTGRIVFTCYIDNVDDICAINADGSGEMRLTNVAFTDFYASFSPDGSQIVFSSRRTGAFLMFQMDRNGGGQQQYGPANLGGIYAPAISPNGQRVAFTAASGGNQNIWLMNRDGSNPVQLTNISGNAVDATWSPDGSQIAFASDKDSSEGELSHYIMNADGTGMVKIETGVANTGGRNDWSPDGRWLAFYAGERNDRNIYLAAVNGSVVYQLTDGGSNLAPSFSPDGNWIAFTSYRDGDAEIFIMRTDGSGVTQLTFNGRPDWQPRWGP